MLILTRKIGESILIGDNITIKVVETGKNSVRILVDWRLSMPNYWDHNVSSLKGSL